MAKAKTLALKSKTKAIKTRLVIFSLLQNKKLLMTSISQKLNALMGHTHNNDHDTKLQLEDDVAGDGSEEQQRQAIVLYNRKNAMWVPSTSAPPQTADETTAEIQMALQAEDEEEEDKYPDLTHSLFESEEMEFEQNPGGSVIDIVKHSKEDKGEEFRLEDEIDRVADLFIRRFHRQMRLQKQLSLKRHHDEMLETSV
ncbi:hypothetical protein CCACVL1_04201 [Corchorus capsularis]|uniref:Uncharacterized protein n=1 Tax=Corchorus capsularis TaxID=210143 RepID=A0A1R3JUU1_COCAP|nr:hypothetical protein CCACVL1_04201 [Corchorus capsularis]